MGHHLCHCQYTQLYAEKLGMFVHWWKSLEVIRCVVLVVILGVERKVELLIDELKNYNIFIAETDIWPIG